MNYIYLFDAYGTLFDVHSAVTRFKDEIGPHAEPMSEMWRIKQLEYTWTRTLMGEYRDFRELTAKATRGCVVLERPDLVKELVVKHGARDTTVRQTALAELDAMTPRFSQWLPGEEVPEKHWMYRIAKKYWFSDFGAYRDVDHDATARAKAGQLAAAGDPKQPSGQQCGCGSTRCAA